MSRFSASRAFAPLFLLAATLTPSAVAQGLVFAATNGSAGNEIVVFSRQAQGQIAPLTTVPTGGTGTGTGLGSQGALVLSADQQWLLAVNAGSNSVTVFQLTGGGLVQTDVEPSGGTQPISVTIHDDLVYVLNAGTPNNVTGFQLSATGQLSPIAGSTQPLSAASTQPAQVELSPLGTHLVVTEKMTNKVDTFTVAANGTLQNFVAHTSSGPTPFGFAFRGNDQVVVSEAFNAAVDGSAVSSYMLSGNNLSVISGSVPTTETAACWIVVTRDGRFAYTTNTGSDSITGFAVSPTGQLTSLDASGVTAATGDAPTDMAFTYRTRFLYVLNSNAGTVSSFGRMATGALVPIQPPTGSLPPGATGLAVL